jgi:hypothetical protein
METGDEAVEAEEQLDLRRKGTHVLKIDAWSQVLGELAVVLRRPCRRVCAPSASSTEALPLLTVKKRP